MRFHVADRKHLELAQDSRGANFEIDRIDDIGHKRAKAVGTRVRDHPADGNGRWYATPVCRASGPFEGMSMS